MWTELRAGSGDEPRRPPWSSGHGDETRITEAGGGQQTVVPEVK